MKLIVGLGNPGIEYKNTRHNIGFMVLDHYLGHVDWKLKYEAYIYKRDMENDSIIFVKPQTYMNLSGLAVKKIVDYYKIDINDILVIQDDLDLPMSSFRIKRNSSSGGHNGIKSIINELQTDSFARLKIGIGKNENIPSDKYVLGKFTDNELSIINNNLKIYDKIIDSFITLGIDETIKLNNMKQE